MGASTEYGKDIFKNICGIAYGHAYSILAAFNILAANGT
jgi:hypothetical protein